MQHTGVRLNLPLPPCATAYTSCQETGLLEQLDGFSVRARLNVSFSGPINTATAAAGIYFVALNNLSAEEPGIHQVGQVITIDQAVWDPTTNTLYAKPYSVLDQHRRYAIVVTDAVQDTAGNAVVAAPAFQSCLVGMTAYCGALTGSLTTIAPTLGTQHLVAAAVFTTMSATIWLEHARQVVNGVAPQAAVLENGVFPVPNLAEITLNEQTGTTPPAFTSLSLPLNNTLLAGLGTLAVGYYLSPNFLGADGSIAPAPSGPDLNTPAGNNIVYFNALLPATPKPAAGYPVVIFGHGFGDSRWGGPTAVAPTLARAGFAVIAINAVGHGFGNLSTVTMVDNQGNSTTLTAGGRGVDLNGDGTIDSEEGCVLITPISYGMRDCFRQTVVDLMQLVRVIQQGLDVDGDGTADLDAGHIYYGGQSLGSMYGTIFTALEPAVRAAALNVGGASTVDIARWSPSYTGFIDEVLGLRSPPLLNAGTTFNQDYVLQGQPVLTVTVNGAMAIQDVLENIEWLGIEGDEIAFAPHLQVSPLSGMTARPVLVQFARGDMTVINPANSALIRAGNLMGSTWEYRHDIALSLDPTLPQNPHPFLVLFVSLGGSMIQLPGLDALAISLDAQGQIAGFLGADGASIPNPNNLSALLFGTNLFQMPTTLPWDFGF
jgi:pimeloyl-ACP methyl ester carboxylesterase